MLPYPPPPPPGPPAAGPRPGQPPPKRPWGLAVAAVAAVVSVALAVLALTGVLSLPQGGGSSRPDAAATTRATASEPMEPTPPPTTELPTPQMTHVQAADFCDIMAGDLASAVVEWQGLSTEEVKRFDELFRDAIAAAAQIEPGPAENLDELQAAVSDGLDALRMAIETGEMDDPALLPALARIDASWESLSAIAGESCPIPPQAP